MYRITVERVKTNWEPAVSWVGDGPQPLEVAGEERQSVIVEEESRCDVLETVLTVLDDFHYDDEGDEFGGDDRESLLTLELGIDDTEGFIDELGDWDGSDAFEYHGFSGHVKVENLS